MIGNEAIEARPSNDLSRESRTSSEFLVPPVHFAFVHLNKPFDVAMVGQTVAATGHLRADMVGQSIDFNHPKVLSKLQSWNIKEPARLLRGKSTHYKTVDELREAHAPARLIGTVVKGGENPFTYEWQDTDIIVLGGANGLSRQDVDRMDATVTIPTPEEIDFLTVSTVVSALSYHILAQRKLWEKLEQK